MPLFWLTYRHPDGRAAGVVVVESGDLLFARLKAALAGADRELRPQPSRLEALRCLAERGIASEADANKSKQR